MYFLTLNFASKNGACFDGEWRNRFGGRRAGSRSLNCIPNQRGDAE